MTLVEQWNVLESGLDPNWQEARLTFTAAAPARLDRAAALLGPANPGRAGNALHLVCGRHGTGVGPEALRRLLRRLDGETITGALSLVASPVVAVERPADRASLAAAWDAEVDRLPSDWSDLTCRLELTSTDHLDRAALLTAPLNPIRVDNSPSFRFRCAHSFGYGASPGMVRRCLERLDLEAIPGALAIDVVLSDTHPAATQGPVWQVGGKTV